MACAPSSSRCVRNALAAACEAFTRQGIPDAMPSAIHLMGAVLGTTSPASVQAAADGGVSMSVPQARMFEGYCKRRLTREPVQYIVGNWDFHCLNSLVVRPPVLIPRPETEGLVDLVVEHVRSTASSTADASSPSRPDHRKPLRLLEIGCGSGAVSIAVLKQLGDMGFPASVVAIDILEDCVHLARENASKFGVSDRLTVVREDVCSQLGSASAMAPPFDVVFSNPPYITSCDIASLPPEVRDFESSLALDGGNDGFTVFRAIMDMLETWWGDCKHGAAFFELGEGQPNQVQSAIASTLEARSRRTNGKSDSPSEDDHSPEPATENQMFRFGLESGKYVVNTHMDYLGVERFFSVRRGP